MFHLGTPAWEIAVRTLAVYLLVLLGVKLLGKKAGCPPKQALLWYGGATLIVLSRVKLNRHYARDVVAGAAVGYLSSRWEMSRPRGLILSPFIRSDRRSASRGIAFSGRFRNVETLSLFSGSS